MLHVVCADFIIFLACRAGGNPKSVTYVYKNKTCMAIKRFRRRHGWPSPCSPLLPHPAHPWKRVSG
ncbi:hypothetical protein PR002_g21558 [Phytophthora rubi]|uniref:Secreted protein n=1 Tax=Phytophthora rubi TaxID=129364 RepID=A0A6A3J478_9STRA|nr:hypothetical protein PR002_g21558 [Phytophthora rubi]